MADRPGIGTRAVHTPPAPTPAQAPLGLAVWRTAAWAFGSAQEYSDLLNGRMAGYSYSRIANPTTDAFGTAVASLEDVTGEALGWACASGMAAVTTTIIALAGGGHVIAPREVYGGTYGLLDVLGPRLGLTVSWVDARDPDAVAAAVTPDTRLVWGEVLANPTIAVADLPALAAVAHAAGVPLAVDATFASPVVCRPLEHGVDVVVHSATKYLGGHGDVTAGVVVARPELLHEIATVGITMGPSLSPDDAFLAHRGLATLPLRVRQQCATATALAAALAEHPAVVKVEHPSLPGTADHDLARKLFDDGLYGAMLTVTVPGGTDGAAAYCDAAGLALIASSLGSHHTKLTPVATTTHRQLSAEALARAGIAGGAVRISCGLEDTEDVVADLVGALRAVSR